MEYNTLQHYLSHSLTRFRDKLAIEYGNKGITYGELDKRTDCIANRLIEQGIEKETFIAILIEDRLELISAVLGVLKAGGVFVPLDPGSPPAWVTRIFRSIDIKYVIIDSFHERRLASSQGNSGGEEPVKFILMDEAVAGRSFSPVNRKTGSRYSPEDKIYIYFTSGTTGIPKAIIGRNKSLLHFINWEIDRFGVDEGFRVSQLTNPGFDAFLRDIFMPLCTGSVVCIPESPETSRDPEALIRWIDRAGINLIHCIPSLFRMINTNHLTGRNFKTLKFVLLSGEKLEPPDLVYWYDTFDDRIQLVNLWGTSETTLAKTCYLISKSDLGRPRISVGQPIKGARVVILDGKMRLCKKGTIGDLYIRTPYRTFGYCNDPELTQARFIPNPWKNDPGDWLHKTGDLGRLLPDGNLEVLGREDRQVKIRGVRIELEEIETVLKKHKLVNEAVVIKKETGGNNEFLCAFVTASLENQPDSPSFISLLKTHLMEKLPAYMVPAILTKMDKIPRNPNGKVDYKKLPDPMASEKISYIPPRNDIEKRVLNLWSEILAIEKSKISMTKRFFELGGNSLNIMNLISKIHREFDIRISLGEIFNNPTLEMQAAIILKAAKHKHLSIVSIEKKEYYALSPGQKRLYFLHRMEPQSTRYNIQLAVILKGKIDIVLLETVFKKSIKRHESLRTSFEIVKEDPFQRIHEYGELQFGIEYYDSEESRQWSGYSESVCRYFVRAFDLSKTSLMRVGLIKQEEEKHLLIIDIHHIITDGTSLALFSKEIITLYRHEELPVLKLQYKDFSAWQNSLNEPGKIRSQEEYWLNRFKGDIPVLNLNTLADFPVSHVKSLEGDSMSFEIDRDLTGKIKEFLLKTGTTLNIALLAVFNVLLLKYTGQEDIIVGQAIAGRHHADLENIIGMFVNMLAMRNQPLENKSFGEFLEDVTKNALEAFENQDYQFDELVMKLGIKREYGRNPISDMVFDFENKMEPGEIPGLKLETYKYENKMMQFYLILKGVEADETITMTFFFMTSLFKRTTIGKMAKNYIDILEQVVENINIILKDITLSHALIESKPALTFEESLAFDF